MKASLFFSRGLFSVISGGDHTFYLPTAQNIGTEHNALRLCSRRTSKVEVYPTYSSVGPFIRVVGARHKTAVKNPQEMPQNTTSVIVPSSSLVFPIPSLLHKWMLPAFNTNLYSGRPRLRVSARKWLAFIRTSWIARRKTGVYFTDALQVQQLKCYRVKYTLSVKDKEWLKCII